MIVLTKLENIFDVLFILSFILAIVLSIKVIYLLNKYDNANNIVTSANLENNHKDNLKNKLEIIIELMIFILYVAITILCLVFRTKTIFLCVIFFVFFVPAYIKDIVCICKSIFSIFKLIDINNNGQLNITELYNILIIENTIWILERLCVIKKIFKMINALNNNFLYDALIAAIYIIIFYVYIFFICSMLPIIFTYYVDLIYMLYKKINKNFSIINKNKNIKKYWIGQIKISTHIEVKSITFFYFKRIKNWNMFIRTCIYLMSPIMILIDAILTICKNAFKTYKTLIEYMCKFPKWTGKYLIQFEKYLLNISDKKILTISFRIATVLSLMCIVILNRYQPIFRMQEQSTEILEFISSSIIIPIVLEWIISIKKD